MSYLIRPVRDDDSPAIAAIYGEAVAHGTASFELSVPTLHDIRARISALTDQGYPWLVAEAGGKLLGYAYAGPYRARPAYRWVVENSVYLDEAARGQGLGRVLLAELVSACTVLGFRQMVAVIGDSANLSSVALHHACGFSMVGTLRQMGWKHGQWLDTVYMQLPLGPGGDIPPEEDSLPGRMNSMVKTA